MPGLDLTLDRLKMQAIAKGLHVPNWVDQKQVEQMIADLESGKMDWGDNALELTRDKKSYPPSAYCDPETQATSWGHRVIPGPRHYISNPARARKMVGTRRIGPKGRKMPVRAVCSGCKRPLVLVDNMVEPDWPLFIDKAILSEWP